MDGDTAEYRKHFLSYLGVAAQVPNVACNALNLFYQSRHVLITFEYMNVIMRTQLLVMGSANNH